MNNYLWTLLGSINYFLNLPFLQLIDLDQIFKKFKTEIQTRCTTTDVIKITNTFLFQFTRLDITNHVKTHQKFWAWTSCQLSFVSFFFYLKGSSTGKAKLPPYALPGSNPRPPRNQESQMTIGPSAWSDHLPL